MSGCRTEEEQIETLKRFWDRFGMILVVGLIVGSISMYGYRHFKTNQLIMAGRAAGIYEELLVSVPEKTSNTKNSKTSGLIGSIQKQYEKTPYAVLAALIAAKQSINENNLSKGIEQLQWAIDHTTDDAVRIITMIRLARVLAANKQEAAALTLLNTIENDSFKGRIFEVKGDIFANTNRLKEAKESYSMADLNYSNTESKIVVQMKLNALPEGISAGGKG